MAEQQQARDQSKELAPITRLAPMRLPVVPSLLNELAVTEPEWRVLTDQIYPSARTADAIAAALNYCRVRNLDPFKRQCHVVPMWSSVKRAYVETIWPGIAELRTTATRTKAYAGIDQATFGEEVEREFVQHIEDERNPRNNRDERHTVRYPRDCQITVWRIVQGIRCPFHAQVVWTEAYATAGRFTDMPNEMWRKRPYGQIEKCTEAAALRRAFPEELGGEMSAEEMHGKVVEEQDPALIIDHVVQPSEHRRPPKPPERRAEKPAAEADRPANGKPATIIDGEVVPNPPAPPPTDAGPDDGSFLMSEGDAEFLANLRDRLGEAATVEQLETIWNDIDPLRHFDGDELNQQTAQSIRDYRLSVLKRTPRK